MKRLLSSVFGLGFEKIEGPTLWKMFFNNTTSDLANFQCLLEITGTPNFLLFFFLFWWLCLPKECAPPPSEVFAVGVVFLFSQTHGLVQGGCRRPPPGPPLLKEQTRRNKSLLPSWFSCFAILLSQNKPFLLHLGFLDISFLFGQHHWCCQETNICLAKLGSAPKRSFFKSLCFQKWNSLVFWPFGGLLCMDFDKHYKICISALLKHRNSTTGNCRITFHHFSRNSFS